jgi:hypothetical protein
VDDEPPAAVREHLEDVVLGQVVDLRARFGRRCSGGAHAVVSSSSAFVSVRNVRFRAILLNRAT